MANVRKKLISPEDLKKQKFGLLPILQLLREDTEISAWLDEVFRMREDGELSITIQGIADELSSFLERRVGRRQVSEAHSEWQRRQKN